MTAFAHEIRRYYDSGQFQVFFLLSTLLLKVVYILQFGDENSGQDAPSYILSAERIIEDGPFAEKTQAPYFPIGYSWFIAIVWKLFGRTSFSVGLFQTFLVTVALYLFYIVVSQKISKQVATITLVLLGTNLSIAISSSLLMYESPMMSFLVIGFCLVIMAEQENSTKKWGFRITASLLFAFAITFQPKVYPATLLIVLLVVWNERKNTSSRKAIATTIIMWLFISIGPSTAIYRNVAAGDGFGYTQNVSTNTIRGTDRAHVKLDYSSCASTNSYDSIGKTLCFVKVKVTNPSEGIRVTASQAVYFWTPFIGNLKFMGTWYHSIDFRRLIPDYNWSDDNGSWSWQFDRLTGYLWSFGLVVSIIIGFTSLWKRSPNPSFVILLIMPVLMNYLVSLLTYSEARYRIPVMPFYTVFIAVSLLNGFNRLSSRQVKINS